MSHISEAAASARESGRAPDGRFGPTHRVESTVDLPQPPFPIAPDASGPCTWGTGESRSAPVTAGPWGVDPEPDIDDYSEAELDALADEAADRYERQMDARWG